MPDGHLEATRQSRLHRGHRIVALQLGGDWFGTVHAPDGAIVGKLEAASAQEVMVRGIGLVNKLLAGAGRS